MKERFQKISKVSSNFWTWASRSWWTRLVAGLCIILITIRLATTCIEIFEIRIGCEEGDDSVIPYEKILD